MSLFFSFLFTYVCRAIRLAKDPNIETIIGTKTIKALRYGAETKKYIINNKKTHN